MSAAASVVVEFDQKRDSGDAPSCIPRGCRCSCLERNRLQELVLSDLWRQIQTTPNAGSGYVYSATSGKLPLALIVDFVLAVVVVGPLITSCWRSGWMAADAAADALPAESRIVSFGCVACGLVSANALSLTTPSLERLAAYGRGSKCRFFVVSKLFTLVSFACCMLLWKGWWDVCDVLCADWPAEVEVTALAGSTAVIGALRHSRSLVGFPLSYCLDEATTYFHVRTFSKDNGVSFCSIGYPCVCF